MLVILYFTLSFIEKCLRAGMKCIAKRQIRDCFNECLWDNKYILIDTKPAHYKSWIKHNVIHLGDIVDNHGCIQSKRSLEDKFNFTIKQMNTIV